MIGVNAKMVKSSFGLSAGNIRGRINIELIFITYLTCFETH